ncbi:hypothetical protein [Maridesulfovibrio sp.]|uniref:hypothetical protein n=1 Tax=unclassified Maridesulfovibrio TaxID=2794999 RepID=UPI003B00DC51
MILGNNNHCGPDDKDSGVIFYATLKDDKPFGQWQVIEDTQEGRQSALDQGAAFFSTVSFEYEPVENKPAPLQQGNLIIDFDSVEGSLHSHNDCIRLVSALRDDYGVDPENLKIWVTGSKGFHLEIPAELFGATPDVSLPLLYKQFMESLIHEIYGKSPCTIDLSMYAGGKGKLLRVENIKRSNGKYKVPITYQELIGLSYPDLFKLAEAPRYKIHLQVCPQKSQQLSELYSNVAESLVPIVPQRAEGIALESIGQCVFIDYCAKNAEHLPEQLWHAMISALKPLRNYELIHELSRRYPNYSREETDRKIAAVKGGMRCSKIKELFNCGKECNVSCPANLWLTADLAKNPKKGNKLSESEILTMLLQKFDFFIEEASGQLYVDDSSFGVRKTYDARSEDFKDLYALKYHEATGKFISKFSRNSSLGLIRTKVKNSGKPMRKLHQRIAHHESAVYVDLGNDRWDAIEITKDGWRIVSNPPVRFKRSAGQMPLPYPEEGEGFTLLRDLFKFSDPRTSTLVEGWLLGTFSAGPYPILILKGEQGTAKSTTSACLRGLVDNSAAINRSVPGSVKDLVIGVGNSFVYSIDNASYLKPDMSDLLCQIATGGTFTTRELYSDDREVTFKFLNPVILNGIGDFAERHDLIDRAIVVELPVIPNEKRISVSEFQQKFNLIAPVVLGSLCTAVSSCLRNIDQVQLDGLPRMADFIKWCVAGEDAMPWKTGEFEKVYMENISNAVERVLEADVIGNAIAQFMQNREDWHGTTAALYNALSDRMEYSTRCSRNWPANSITLGKRLDRSQAFLRKSGINIERTRKGCTYLTITNDHFTGETVIGNKEITIDQMFGLADGLAG